MSQGVYVLGGKCPGGKCPGGKCPGGISPWGKCLGGTCPGGYVLEPVKTCALFAGHVLELVYLQLLLATLLLQWTSLLIEIFITSTLLKYYVENHKILRLMVKTIV